MTRLTGKLVRLRELTSADQPQLRELVNDPEVMRASSIYAPVSDVQQESWFRSAMQNPHARWFGIEDARGEPALVGTCCLVDIEWIGRTAELRVRLDRSAWGGGLGTDACELLLAFGFDDLNLERIGLRVWGRNTRAQRVYEKLGFVLEGRLRGAGFINGQRDDIVLMGLLREEWRAQKPSQ
ncbi:MAG: GNAT family N-acetyltransferase [Myxococcota bacterium]|nr:GNAT family N-acetyltransferase [Deltaproteobacteria bacterium]MDQ3340884.1 GNAT family N-acetyltransferase [Myxococcota bacterium]